MSKAVIITCDERLPLEDLAEMLNDLHDVESDVGTVPVKDKKGGDLAIYVSLGVAAISSVASVLTTWLKQTGATSVTLKSNGHEVSVTHRDAVAIACEQLERLMERGDE